RAARLARFTGATDYAALGEADLIIEAVFEDMDVKLAVFAQLDRVAKPGAVLATNTSYLDVDRIAQATRGPADVLGLHFFSTIMVALGTLVSATWILASNSWMQTPAGYEILDGRVVPTDWLAVIFNPSFPYRLAHMGIAAFLATALMVGASGAW
ncbi:3-hydroxyacyl-CoA dehydrogenase family protein, partial [Achromobacter xylosoxidans]